MGATVVLSATELSASDPDDAAAGLVFAVSNVAGGRDLPRGLPGFTVVASFFEAFCRGEEATTAIEYAFIASLVEVAGFTALVSLGNTLETMYGAVGGGVSNAVSGGG